jgi:hypothetical protein
MFPYPLNEVIQAMKVFSAATCNKIWCVTALVRNVYEVCVIVSALTLSN